MALKLNPFKNGPFASHYQKKMEEKREKDKALAQADKLRLMGQHEKAEAIESKFFAPATHALDAKNYIVNVPLTLDNIVADYPRMNYKITGIEADPGNASTAPGLPPIATQKRIGFDSGSIGPSKLTYDDLLKAMGGVSGGGAEPAYGYAIGMQRAQRSYTYSTCTVSPGLVRNDGWSTGYEQSLIPNPVAPDHYYIGRIKIALVNEPEQDEMGECYTCGFLAERLDMARHCVIEHPDLI